jgi:DNA-binding GntR family transcriptional regulator
MRRAILTGHLKPGQKLVESELAQQLGVSRNPIREAFGQLQVEGLVTTIPNLGAYVANPTHEELRDALILRAHLEWLAVRLILAKAPPVDLDRLVESLEKAGSLIPPTEEVSEDAYGLFNLCDAEFHQSLVERSGSPALLRTWMTASPADLIFLYDARMSFNRRELEAILDTHRLILEALRSRDERRAQAALANHFQAPSRRGVYLDEQAVSILDW